MKDKFKEYYTPSNEEFSELWKTSHFIFDTNVLLSLYRYSKETKNDWIEVLNLLSDENRIFLPYQIGFEFHKNYFNEIELTKSFMQNKVREIKTIRNSIEELINNEKRIKEKKLEVLEKVEDFSKYLEEIFKSEEQDFSSEDSIIKEFNKLFKNKTGSEPDVEKIKISEKVAEERFSKNIPPGFEDKNKNSNRYGDYIIWEQMMDYSLEKKLPIIYVTNDSKNDWWLRDKEKKIIQPNPSLIKEFNQKTKNDYYQYQADSFLKYAKQYLNTKIADKSIEETLTVAKENKELSDLELIQENDRVSTEYLKDYVKKLRDEGLYYDFEKVFIPSFVDGPVNLKEYKTIHEMLGTYENLESKEDRMERLRSHAHKILEQKIKELKEKNIVKNSIIQKG